MRRLEKAKYIFYWRSLFFLCSPALYRSTFDTLFIILNVFYNLSWKLTSNFCIVFKYKYFEHEKYYRWKVCIEEWAPLCVVWLPLMQSLLESMEMLWDVLMIQIPLALLLWQDLQRVLFRYNFFINKSIKGHIPSFVYLPLFLFGL